MLLQVFGIEMFFFLVQLVYCDAYFSTVTVKVFWYEIQGRCWRGLVSEESFVIFLGHVVWFWVPQGLQIIADCNKLWFSLSAGVCCRGQKDKQGWRLAVWAQSGEGGRGRKDILKDTLF